MRIEPLLAAARVYRVEQRDRAGVAAGVLEHVIQPVVEIAARAQHDLGVGQRPHIAGARLVLMRVGVGREDLLDVRPAARDSVRHVTELRCRGDDARSGARGIAVPATGGEHRCAERHGEHGDEAARDRHRGPTLAENASY